MATNLDIPVFEMPTETKQQKVGLTRQKQLFQKEDFQGASQCGETCPTCQQEGHSGTCRLEAGHTQEHQCNRDSSHHWSGTSRVDVPGPHHNP